MKPIIGIIGFGIVGRAVQFGMSPIADFRIYDIDSKSCQNTFEEVCKDSEYIYICVPTPMDAETGESDYSIVNDTIKKCSEYVRNTKKLLIIKSTVVPGTTNKLIEKYPDVRIIVNPEFLRENSYRLDFINTSRIIIGGESDNTRRLMLLYRKRFPPDIIMCTDATTAETIKCFSNCFLASKVSLCNEFYDICESLGIDYNKVMHGVIRDGRIGNSHTTVPGHDGDRGFGGLCFPKDLCATIKMAEENGVDPIIMKSVWEKNLKVRKNKDWLYRKGAVSRS